MCTARFRFEGCRYCILRVTPCDSPRRSHLRVTTARFRSQAHAEARQEPRQDITRDALREDVGNILTRLQKAQRNRRLFRNDGWGAVTLALPEDKGGGLRPARREGEAFSSS